MNKFIKKTAASLLAVLMLGSAGIPASAAKEKYDFSENHMISHCSDMDPNGYSGTADDGGNAEMAAAYLARWSGAVFEENDPYPASGLPGDVEYLDVPADMHVQNIQFVYPGADGSDRDSVKKAVINRGAVYASFMVRSDCYNGDATSYYLPEKMFDLYTVGGHAITIVGWDDNYSRTKFRFRPEGDGAFICKNSWSKSSGEKGYFYLSYYDAGFNFGDYVAAYYGVESKTNYNKIYQYDPLGPINAVGNPEENTLLMANVFPQKGKTLSAKENLKAVSFYTDEEGIRYEIHVVTDYKTMSDLNGGTKVASGIMPYAGYHTVKFSSVTLKKGTRFAVIVKLINVQRNSVGTFIESPLEGYSEAARANAGESFYFDTDENKWTDMTTAFENSNACIKAFTNSASVSTGALAQGIDNSLRAYTSEKTLSASEITARGGVLNPDYLATIQADGTQKTVKGLRVSPAQLAKKTAVSATADSLPAKYDLRDYNCVTKVKNQKDIGACWAFSACASMESCLMKQDAGLTDQIGGRVYSVSAEDISVKYKQDFVPELTVNADAGSDYTVEYSFADPSMLALNPDGSLRSTGTGTTTVTVTVRDYKNETKATDTFKVTSKYTFLQWLIRIFMLGFLWY